MHTPRPARYCANRPIEITQTTGYSVFNPDALLRALTDPYTK